MIEIHNERVRDLLDPDAGSGERHRSRSSHDPVEGPYVEGLTPCAVRDYDEIRALMDRGAKARTTAATAMNATSSRAHTVTELRGDGRNRTVRRFPVASRWWISREASVRTRRAPPARDSRKARPSTSRSARWATASPRSPMATGQIRREDGTASRQYSDAAPSRIAGRELAHGDDRRALSAAVNYEETLGTLRFADRARNIVSSATVNREMRERTRPGSARAWDEAPQHGKRHVDGHGRRAAPRRRSRSQRLAGRRGDGRAPARARGGAGTRDTNRRGGERVDGGIRRRGAIQTDARRRATRRASHSRPSHRRRRRPRVGGGHRRHVGRHWAQE